MSQKCRDPGSIPIPCHFSSHSLHFSLSHSYSFSVFLCPGTIKSKMTINKKTANINTKKTKPFETSITMGAVNEEGVSTCTPIEKTLLPHQVAVTEKVFKCGFLLFSCVLTAPRQKSNPGLSRTVLSLVPLPPTSVM